MKPLATVACLIITASLAVAIFQKSVSARRSEDPSDARRYEPNRDPSAPPVPVIVELFTSEGCSSCPPADALLMQLESEQPVPGVEVVALEEHVDYWNDLGWVDPFSSSELTQRQQRYAETFGHGSSYTPQMVVDGQWEFVGSRSNQARNTIAEAAKYAQSEVAISRAGSGPDGPSEWNITVQRLEPASSSDTAEVWLAVTETRLHSNVERGENAGRDLPHAAVVRQLIKLGTVDLHKDPLFSSTAKLNLRPEWNRQNLRVVAFVQQKKSRHIVGAASAKVAQ